MQKITKDGRETLLLVNKAIMKKFPKVELHRHLEGTFPVKKLHELSIKNKLDMPTNFIEFKKTVQFPKNSAPDFLTFLAKFKNDWYRSYDDVSYITYHSVKELASDGIFYIELRFSPEHFSFINDFDRKEITSLIIEAGNRAAKEIGFDIKYLLTFNRNKQTQEEMIILYNGVKKLNIESIVGIDLAGDEINYPPELFKEFFSRIQRDGIYKTTVHAGEVTTPTQIWVAVKELNASRIGHGTVAIKDTNLQTYLKNNEIALEQCITSNYQTGSWVDEKNHPIGRLYRNGVPVTLNSDDPFIQDTDLTDDYIKAVKYFNFDLNDLINLNLTAIKTSFQSKAEQERLKSAYLDKVELFKKEFL